MADLPVACTLSPEALKARREGLLSGLLGRADDTRNCQMAIGCASRQRVTRCLSSPTQSRRSVNVAVF
jgi:hypothetical protein